MIRLKKIITADLKKIMERLNQKPILIRLFGQTRRIVSKFRR